MKKSKYTPQVLADCGALAERCWNYQPPAFHEAMKKKNITKEAFIKIYIEKNIKYYCTPIDWGKP